MTYLRVICYNCIMRAPLMGQSSFLFPYQPQEAALEKKDLEKTAYAPYETIRNPGRKDWKAAYDALVQLAAMDPENGSYPNTLGYLCYYGRHTGRRDYAEAREWFEKGAALCVIESTYKLADMLMNGWGGEADPDQAYHYYSFLYFYCKNHFESGIENSKFADIALRIGRLFHEGRIVPKDDTEALGYLLEARFALEKRKRFSEYGDQTVEKNILSLMEECEKPDRETMNNRFHGLYLGRVPRFFLNENHLLAFTIVTGEDGLARLEFRRKRKDGQKSSRVLWAVPPAMKCFLTEFVVLFSGNISLIWNKNPGEPVICDRYEHDEEHDLHLFYLNDELQCKLMGGDYALSMDELILAESMGGDAGPF